MAESASRSAATARPPSRPTRSAGWPRTFCSTGRGATTCPPRRSRHISETEAVRSPPFARRHDGPCFQGGPMAAQIGLQLFTGYCQGNTAPWCAILWRMNEHAFTLSYKRHRFPAEIIGHAVWLYFRFALSYRDVEELLAERGVILTYETIRQWCQKFGQV